MDAANPPDDDTDDDSSFRTITAALRAAQPGDLIRVAPGRYDVALGEEFPLLIDKELALVSSAGPEQTVIDAGGVGAPAVVEIRIRAGRASLRGFTLRGVSGERAAGVAVLGTTGGDVRIEDNIIEEIAAAPGSYAFGIRIFEVEGGRVEVVGNTVRRVAGNGISVGHSQGVEVRANRIYRLIPAMIDGLEYSVGIALNASAQVVVEHNEISRATLGISLMGSSGCLVRANRLTQNFQEEPISYAGAYVTLPGGGIVVAFDSRENAILENLLEGNGMGIVLYFAEENELEGNRLLGNGISTVTFEGETIHGVGLALDYSNRNRLLENLVEGNGDVGVALKDSALNLLEGNTIAEHRNCGLLIREGVKGAPNSIEGNLIRGAFGPGIKLESGYSEIAYNEITANGTGIELLATASAKDHKIRENNIYDNGFGVRNRGQGVLDARENWWGDPSGPYHPQLNPTGKGDQVSDNVEFEPWRTARVSPEG